MSDQQHSQDHSDLRAKHLDMIQAVVSRLAGNSAAMKRYCLIVVAVGIGTYKALDVPSAVPALAIIVLVFWLLDVRYLQQEKRFRALHNEVRLEASNLKPDFRLDAPNRFEFLKQAILSWSTVLLYLALFALLIYLWKTAAWPATLS